MVLFKKNLNNTEEFMAKFELLKRTYPISEFERPCDGYKYIIETTTEKERKSLKIDKNSLQQTIKKDEKYIYQVAKEDGKFKTKAICFKNLAIIQEKLFKFVDK